MNAQAPYAERDGYLHSGAKSGTFKTGARAKIGVGRVRARRSFISSKANDTNASAMVVDMSTEIEAESSYAERQGHVHLGANSGVFNLGAGVKGKMSAGRVRAKRTIVSNEAKGLNSSAMVEEEIDAEGQHVGGVYALI